jgi:hypothetical protein
MKNPKTGVYETIYGNACYYEEDSHFAEDLDMRENIPICMVDFSKFLRDEL